jgi:MoaA/NifB/PqqE/SkfB family radical SAM enzyme
MLGVPDLQLVKQQMLSGERPSTCNKCWKLEDMGLKSDRQIKNETLDWYFNRDIKLIVDDCRDNRNSIIHYKIDTSTVCNATCVTCSSNSSSAWAQLERKHGEKPAKTWQIKLNDVILDIDYKNAKSIGFRGGEPFLSDTNFYILEKLIEHNNLDCFISFTTNGSLDITEYQKKILSQFKNVNFCFSIDGVGVVFEYLRYPLTWSKLLENIEYCKQNNILISASYTISNVNIFYHDETTAWFNSQNINYINNLVTMPTYFKPSSLSQLIKQSIISQKNNLEITKLLQNHIDNDDTEYLKFLNEIHKQDCWKGINIADYLPEFAKLIK